MFERAALLQPATKKVLKNDSGGPNRRVLKRISKKKKKNRRVLKRDLTCCLHVEERDRERLSSCREKRAFFIHTYDSG